MFFDNLSQYGSRLALIDDKGQEVTYAQLDAWANDLKRKVKSRQLAFCLCENSVGSPLGYIGFLKSRIVPLLLDRQIDRGLLDKLLFVYQPTYLYYPADMAGRFIKYRTIEQEFGYILGEKNDWIPVDIHPDLALLLTTSGSTGSPKLVRQSYRNIQSNTESIVKYLNITQTERPITTLPMYYTYGLSIINSHLAVGAVVLLTHHSMWMKSFWDFFRNQSATSFGGVPFTYEQLRRSRFFQMKVPSLRYMTQAGGKLSPSLQKEFGEWAHERGKEFIIMYGQTEATARMGYLPDKYCLSKVGSMGIAIPGGRFELIDIDGSVINEPDKAGELIYYGDNVTMGYAQGTEDLALGDEREGRLNTGDIAKYDKEGFFYISGRLKRFLKIYGNRVNLDEVDQIIQSHFNSVDCASTGVDNRMITYITDAELVDNVRSFLANITHISVTAFDVRYISEIPKNEAGKVLYNALPIGDI